MKLPPDVEFYEDIRLIVWRPHGLVNKAAVNKVITVLRELETAFKEPFNRLSDTVAADAVDLNFEYIISVSLYRRRFYGNRQPIKSAILATDATLIHYGKVHALLTQGSAINVRVFQDRKEATKWLGVPIRTAGNKCMKSKRTFIVVLGELLSTASGQPCFRSSRGDRLPKGD